MAKQLDIVPGGDKLAVAKSTVANPGSGIGVRMVIDDTLITSRTAALMALTAIRQRISEDTWPIA